MDTEPDFDYTAREETMGSNPGAVSVEDVPQNAEAEDEEDECRVCRSPAEEG